MVNGLTLEPTARKSQSGLCQRLDEFIERFEVKRQGFFGMNDGLLKLSFRFSS